MTVVTYPVWINAKPESSLPVTDRGLAYGDGVFETVRCQPRMVLLDEHLERLEKGLQLLGLPVSIDAVRSSIASYADHFSPGLIKVIVTRGSGGRGYLPPESPEPRIIIQGFDLPTYSAAWYREGVAVFLCQTTVSGSSSLRGLKHLNRLEQVMARREFSGAEYQEGLMADDTQSYLEGTMSNLFLIKDEVLLMPPLATQAVQGTMQRFVVEICRQTDCSYRELDLVSEHQLLDADRVFVCNSVFGLWPVRRLMHRDLAVKPSELFDHIQHKVMSLFS